HLRVAGAIDALAEADGNAAFAEADHAELAAARHALVDFAVVQDEGLLGLAGAALLGARGHPDLQPPLVGAVGGAGHGAARDGRTRLADRLHPALCRPGAIHEHVHVVQHALGIDALGIEHHAATAEGTETARLELPELRLAQRLVADFLGPQ